MDNLHVHVWIIYNEHWQLADKDIECLHKDLLYVAHVLAIFVYFNQEIRP